MKLKDHSSSTTTKSIFTVSLNQDEISSAKNDALAKLSQNLKIDGFRQGKIPSEVIEKNINPQTLQSETISKAIDSSYGVSLDQKNLIPIGQPQITISKFVPYSTLEYKVEVEIIGNLKISDYTKFGLKLKPIAVTDKQVNDTIEVIRQRASSFSKVDRLTKKGDRLLIDFKGKDFKTGKQLEPATAYDYFLTLGSHSFIEGFEEKLTGQKPGKIKPFTLTFPKDYPDKEFQSRKVTFTVTIKQIEEPALDLLDDKFAAKIGPFQSMTELKNQVTIELRRENDQTARRNLDNEILNKLAETAKCQIPASLIESEKKTIEEFDQQNAISSGMTWKEFLKAQKLTEASYKIKLKPAAERRIKSGLALIEIAKAANISVSQSEVDEQIAELKKQYTDPQMLAELDKENVKNDLTKRILTEKVLEHIRSSN